jgi:TetR/AcrR family transcriptional repressor of nem operon
MTGRPKSFDIAHLMDESVTLFWRQGYQATSVRDVAKAANITTGTLYNEFNGKDDLYAATVEHYFKKVIKPRVDSILLAKHPSFLTKSDMDSPIARLQHFLNSSVHNLPPTVAYQSCLLLNTQSEFGNGDSAIQTVTRNASNYVAAAFLNNIKQAKVLGLINSNITNSQVQVLISIFFSGLLSTAKQTKNSKNLTPAIDIFFQQLQR